MTPDPQAIRDLLATPHFADMWYAGVARVTDDDPLGRAQDALSERFRTALGAADWAADHERLLAYVRRHGQVGRDHGGDDTSIEFPVYLPGRFVWWVEFGDPGEDPYLSQALAVAHSGDRFHLGTNDGHPTMFLLRWAELDPILEAAARDGRNAAVLPFLRLLLHPMVDFTPTDPLTEAARRLADAWRASGLLGGDDATAIAAHSVHVHEPRWYRHPAFGWVTHNGNTLRNPDNWRGPRPLRTGDPTPFFSRWRALLRAVGAPD